MAGVEGLALYRQQLVEVACLHALHQHLRTGDGTDKRSDLKLSLSGKSSKGTWPGDVPSPFDQPLHSMGVSWTFGSRSSGPEMGLSFAALLSPPHMLDSARPPLRPSYAADLSALLQLYRVSRVVDAAHQHPPGANLALPGSVQTGGASLPLLLEAVQAARITSNFALCARMLPTVSAAAKAAFVSSGSPSSLDSRPQVSHTNDAIVECLVAVLQIEANGVVAALPKSLGRQLAALKPLLPDLLSRASISPETNADVALAFLTASHWLSRAPPNVSKAVSDNSGVDWKAVLKTLASETEYDETSTISQPGMQSPLSTSACTSQRSVPTPEALLAMHPAKSACCLAALRLSPSLPQAWLQWGNQLYSWTRERRHQISASAARSQTRPGLRSGSDRTEIDGFVASAEALCTYLTLMVSQGSEEGGCGGERHLPLLLRLLHVRPIMLAGMEVLLIPWEPGCFCLNLQKI